MAFEDILLTCEIGFEKLIIGRLSGDTIFSFEELQAHISSTEVAGDIYQVGGFGAATANNFTLLSLTDASDADDETGDRCGGIATDEINALLLARETDAVIKFVDMLHGEAA